MQKPASRAFLEKWGRIKWNAGLFKNHFFLLQVLLVYEYGIVK